MSVDLEKKEIEFSSNRVVDAEDHLSRILSRPICIQQLESRNFNFRLHSSSIGGFGVANASFLHGGRVACHEQIDNISVFFVENGGQKHLRGSVCHDIAPGEALVVNTATLSETQLCQSNKHRFIEFSISESEAMIRRFVGRDVKIPLTNIAKFNSDTRESIRISIILSTIHDFLRSSECRTEENFTIRLLREAALSSIIESLPIFRHILNITSPANLRPWQLNRALDFIQSQKVPVTIQDVAESIGIGVRSLQITFVKNLGVSPNAYLRRVRLDAVRREIINSSAPTLIANIARKWGFMHAGKFSADYKAFFGESPSETRRRWHV